MGTYIHHSLIRLMFLKTPLPATRTSIPLKGIDNATAFHSRPHRRHSDTWRSSRPRHAHRRRSAGGRGDRRRARWDSRHGGPIRSGGAELKTLTHRHLTLALAATGRDYNINARRPLGATAAGA